jgi:hypothetical protein
MSALLQRFRQVDADKFLRTFGTDGLYAREAGSNQWLRAIFRSPAQANSVLAGLTVENTTPSILFKTGALVGATPVHGDTWTDEDQAVWIVDGVSSDAPNGWTRLNLSEQ